jgi:outer membrane protein TolC
MKNKSSWSFALRVTAIASMSVLVAGCASFSADGGFDSVSRLTKERTGKPVALQRTDSDRKNAQSRVNDLLREVLTADSAVDVALLNNRGLQSRLAGLGIAEADYVRAGRLPNPVFGFGRLSGGGSLEIDRGVLFNVLGLLALPVASQIGQRQFEQAQYQAAHDTVSLAAEVRRAYFRAVASQQLLKYFEQVKETADAANELAKRMLQAGNFNKLTQMREQAFYADAVAQLSRARHQALADCERLVRLLGLSGEQLKFRLQDRLPDLPKQPVEPADAERTALEKRIDVLLATRNAEATAKSLGLTRATRFINVLEVGYQNKSETGAPRASGYEIEFELPLFDFGSTRAARAEATYMQAANRVAEVATNARSEVRESHSAYRTTYDLAKHYRDEVVPLRKRISEENLLRYNGMLISVFELLADAREQISGVNGYVQALRDFWIADTNLRMALTGLSPGPSNVSQPPTETSTVRAEGH